MLSAALAKNVENYEGGDDSADSIVGAFFGGFADVFATAVIVVLVFVFHGGCGGSDGFLELDEFVLSVLGVGDDLVAWCDWCHPCVRNLRMVFAGKGEKK